MAFTLEELNARVLSRAAASPDESYTAKLLSEGIERCAKKFGEEAVEAVIAAIAGKKKPMVSEAGDVIYHLLVLLKAAGVSLDEVMANLEGRTAQSGLAEKASRK
jgi:phosphoribosyl-ATP pyrophosphohydrolase